MMFAATTASDSMIVAFGGFFGLIGVGTWWKVRAGTYTASRSTAHFGIVVCGIGAVALIGLGVSHLLTGG